MYVKHRIRRLPDSPSRIARGISAGVFVCFTPFYGFHFITAFIVARLIGGNILAALLSTFFGNPITFPFIAAISVKTGYWMLGLRADKEVEERLREGGAEEIKVTLMESFSGAFADLGTNLMALFTDAVANWDRLTTFYERLFLPFLLGGILPGFIVALICYHLTLPVITAYQKRRSIKMKKKLDELRAVSEAARAKSTGSGG